MPNEALISELLSTMDTMKKFSNYRMDFFGLNRGEYFMLVSIHDVQHHGEGISVSALSRKNQITKPAITQMVNTLEAKGLVVRSPDAKDRRIVRVSVTESGRELLRRAHCAFHEIMVKIIGELGEEDTKQLIRIFTKMNDLMEDYIKKNGGKIREPRSEEESI